MFMMENVIMVRAEDADVIVAKFGHHIKRNKKIELVATSQSRSPRATTIRSDIPFTSIDLNVYEIYHRANIPLKTLSRT